MMSRFLGSRIWWVASKLLVSLAVVLALGFGISALVSFLKPSTPAVPAAPAASFGGLIAKPAAAASTSVAVQAANKLLLGFTTAETNTAAAKNSLGKLTVAKSGTTAGYSRSLFPHWRDASTWGWPVAPNNKCDSRGAALYRDGLKVTMSAICTKLAGRWLDPYTGKWFSLASDMDIDHMVPLAEAWRSGANKWTTDARTKFANNPLVEVTAEDNANQSKGDRDPAVWQPANTAARCLYAKRWISVKTQFKLTIDTAEKSALTGMLGTC